MAVVLPPDRSGAHIAWHLATDSHVPRRARDFDLNHAAFKENLAPVFDSSR